MKAEHNHIGAVGLVSTKEAYIMHDLRSWEPLTTASYISGPAGVSSWTALHEVYLSLRVAPPAAHLPTRRSAGILEKAGRRVPRLAASLPTPRGPKGVRLGFLSSSSSSYRRVLTIDTAAPGVGRRTTWDGRQWSYVLTAACCGALVASSSVGMGLIIKLSFSPKERSIRPCRSQWPWRERTWQVIAVTSSN